MKLVDWNHGPGRVNLMSSDQDWQPVTHQLYLEIGSCKLAHGPFSCGWNRLLTGPRIHRVGGLRLLGHPDSCLHDLHGCQRTRERSVVFGPTCQSNSEKRSNVDLSSPNHSFLFFILSFYVIMFLKTCIIFALGWLCHHVSSLVSRKAAFCIGFAPIFNLLLM